MNVTAKIAYGIVGVAAVFAVLVLVFGENGETEKPAAVKEPTTQSYEIAKRDTEDLGRDGTRKVIYVTTDAKLTEKNMAGIGLDFIDKECKPSQKNPYWMIFNDKELATLHCDRNDHQVVF